jgi:hypothetical protein
MVCRQVVANQLSRFSLAARKRKGRRARDIYKCSSLLPNLLETVLAQTETHKYEILRRFFSRSRLFNINAVVWLRRVLFCSLQFSLKARRAVMNMIMAADIFLCGAKFFIIHLL